MVNVIRHSNTWVGEGVRTLGHWSHNPALYQLSYAHQNRRIGFNLTKTR